MVVKALLIVAYAFGARDGVLSVTPAESLAQCEAMRVALVLRADRASESGVFGGDALYHLSSASIECLVVEEKRS